MDRNDMYTQYCDEVSEKIKSENPKTRDDVYSIVEEIKSSLIQDIEDTIDAIAEDYCEKNNIYDED